jgi:hypothetical protein
LQGMKEGERLGQVEIYRHGEGEGCSSITTGILATRQEVLVPQRHLVPHCI